MGHPGTVDSFVRGKEKESLPPPSHPTPPHPTPVHVKNPSLPSFLSLFLPLSPHATGMSKNSDTGTVEGRRTEVRSNSVDREVFQETEFAT